MITLDYRNTLEAIGLATNLGPDGQDAALIVKGSPTGTVDVKRIKANDEAEIKRLQAMMIDRVLPGVEGADARRSSRTAKGRNTS